jgi:putative PIN family toxin of toxin-antitoxin system
MQTNKKNRLVVDVSIWIRALLSPKFHVRTREFFKSENLLVASKALFDELADTLRKPYLAERIERTNYEGLVSLLQRNAELIEVRSVVEMCRDPNDNYLLALAKDGNADYLITGDKDLLVLKEFEKTKIIDMKEFETR